MGGRWKYVVENKRYTIFDIFLVQIIGKMSTIVVSKKHCGPTSWMIALLLCFVFPLGALCVPCCPCDDQNTVITTANQPAAAAPVTIQVNQSNQPQQSYPPQGYPPQGYPPHGYPPQGYPPQNYPGYPPQGYPPAQGFNPQIYAPQQGYPPQQGYAPLASAPQQVPVAEVAPVGKY